MKKEELIGNQKKLDKNHNGKLDAQDFKMLRKEEVEELDELSQGTLANYTQKAAHDVGNKMRSSGIDTGIASQLARTQDKKELAKTFEKDAAQSHSKALTRLQGIKTATKKLSQEQVEELDEGKVKELSMDIKDMAHDEFHKKYGNPKSHYDPTNFKKPVQPGHEMDRAKSLAQRGMQAAMRKEEVSQEMSPYVKGTLAVMDEGKIDDLRDAQRLRKDNTSAYSKSYKPDTSHPHITVNKGTSYGGANQKDDEGDEKKPDNETQEKRGRGRPAGKVGKYKARGSKSVDKDVDDREYQLHLPK
jgi:hypothetical protein